MSTRSSSDGSVSPGGLPLNNGQRSSMKAPALPGVPSWGGPARASGGVSLNGDPFRSSTSSNGSLRAAAVSFKPGTLDKLDRLRFLSLNTTDDSPTIVSSTPAVIVTVQEPIGTRNSSNTSPTHPRAWFTTDVDPGKPSTGSHFLLIQGLKESEVGDGVIALLEETYAKEIRGKKLLYEDGNYVEFVVFIDDMRCAATIFEDLSSEGTLATSYVSHDWYSNAKSVHFGSIVDPSSMYAGQVTFTAEFKGRTVDFNKAVDMSEFLREYAQSFGAIYAFEQVKHAPYPTWQCRAEYHQISAAEAAINKAGEGDKLESPNGWTIFAKQYAPPSYGRHTSSISTASSRKTDTNTAQAVTVLPNGAEIVMSPTGRTAWYTGPDGVDHPVAPPRPVANMDRIAMNNNEAAPRIDQGFTAAAASSALALTGPRPPLANNFHHDRQDHHWSFDAAPGHVVHDSTNDFFNGEPQRTQDIDPARIYAGQDVRTTVMLRNIPNHWTWRELKAVLDDVCCTRYNFMYLRIDFKENKNVGYAFVNFENALYICDFVAAYVGKPWENIYSSFGKTKLVQMSYATIQGLDQLIDKFRNSSIMDELVDYRPILLQTIDEKAKDELHAEQLRAQGIQAPRIAEIGEKKVFPAPNNRAKKERSTANAGQIGLFSPRTHRNANDRWFRSQYDRGTPAQLMEDYSSGPSYAGPSNGAVMLPPHLAAFTYGPPRFQAMYPPTMGMPFNGPPQPMPFMAPHCMMPARQGFMPDAPARAFPGGMPVMPPQAFRPRVHWDENINGGINEVVWDHQLTHPVGNQNHVNGNGAAHDGM